MGAPRVINPEQKRCKECNQLFSRRCIRQTGPKRGKSYVIAPKIWANRSFCSNACKSLNERIYEDRQCLFCQKYIIVLDGNYHRNRKFCSRKHYFEFIKTDKKHRRKLKQMPPVKGHHCFNINYIQKYLLFALTKENVNFKAMNPQYKRNISSLKRRGFLKKRKEYISITPKGIELAETIKSGNKIFQGKRIIYIPPPKLSNISKM
jgi:predicted transcriptional regulator